MSVPGVAVCIPAYEEADYLPGLLRSLVNQTVKPSEVVIADSSNNYGYELAQTIASHYGVRVIRTDSGNVSKARNDAYFNTRAEVIVFADADSRLDPNYIESMRDVPDFRIKQGAVTYYDSPVHAFLYSIMDRIRTQPTGPGMTLTRATLDYTGGFNESIEIGKGQSGEEAELANRVSQAASSKCYIRAWETTIRISARRIKSVGLTRYLTGNPWDDIGFRSHRRT